MDKGGDKGVARRAAPVAAGFFVCLAVVSALYFHAASTFAEHDSLTYFEGRPLLTNLDGYYYLRLAEDLDQGRYEPMDELRGLPRPLPVPLLVRALALASSLTGLDMRTAAYCLPSFLALAMTGVYFLWGMSLGGARTAVLAALAGGAAPYWFVRTVPGRLDTDCLNPVFLYLILFFAMAFALRRDARRYLYLAGALAMGFAFHLWWPRFGLLALGVAVVFYGFSVFVPAGPVERRVKQAILAAATLALAVPLFGLENVLPDALRDVYTTVGGHIDLITKQREGIWFRTGESVDELAALAPLALARGMSGNVLAALCALAGLGITAVRKPEKSLFLAGGALVGVFGLIAARFLIFLIPLFALGLAVFVDSALYRGILLRLPLKDKWAEYAAWCAGVLAVLPAFVGAWTWNAPPPADAGQAFLARQAAQGSRPGDMVWCWWDFGYFVQYFSGRPTFIDGGMVSADRLYVSSVPLYADDPVLASNWMRYFTAHGMGGLEKARAAVGSMAGADAFLKLALSGGRGLEEAEARFPLADVGAMRAYLFAEATPLVLLSLRVMDYARWWGRYGALDLESGNATSPEIYRIPLALVGNLEGGVVGLGHKEARIRRAVRPAQGGLLSRDMHGDGEYTALILDTIARMYLMENAMADSLAARLLFRSPGDTPGFAPVFYNPLLGGVWKAG